VRLGARAYQTEWSLHAWIGVVCSVLAFVSFFCGVFALFRSELTIWQDPALHRQLGATEQRLSYEALLARVREQRTLPTGARVAFTRYEASHWVAVLIHDPATQRDTELWIEPQTGRVREGYSRLADELYEMHFVYQLPFGSEIAGVAAMAFFIASLTGILIHLKDLRRALWRFRPQLRLRFSSSDAHKVLGVFGLPFALMYAWTGTLLGLLTVLSGIVTTLVLPGDVSPGDASGSIGSEAELVRPMAASAPLDAWIERARTAVPERLVQLVVLDGWAQHGSILGVYFTGSSLVDSPFVEIDAETGALIRIASGAESPLDRANRVMFDLHYATYGGLLLKVLYAVLTYGTCAVIVTGNLIWLERRDPARRRAANRFLERTTIAVPGGLALASAGYFALNRLLPESLAQRAHWEFGLFLMIWAVAAIAAYCPRVLARHAAGGLCCAASVLLFAVLLLELLQRRVPSSLSPTHAELSLWIVDGLLLALAIGSAALGRRSLRHARSSAVEAAPILSTNTRTST